MKVDLWKECLSCKDKCCKWDIASLLFITPEEKKKIIGINSSFPCVFFNQNELCDIYKIRPFDCRIFPFDIMEINGRFNWIIWNFNCPIILKRNKEEFEVYLKQLEEKLIPQFKDNLKNYSKFKLKEFLSKYQYEILREVKL